MSNREEIINRFREQIDQWNDKIIDYEKIVFKANHEIRFKLDREIERLKQKKYRLSISLKELENSKDTLIENMAGDLNRSLKEAKNAFSKASVKIYNAIKL